MTVGELYSYFSEKIPASLSCEWDNDGLMCCPDKDAQVRRVLLTLDVTDEAADAAIERGCDLIISHHPLIFSPLCAVGGEDAVSASVIKLILSGVSVFSFHTRLDAMSGGVNDSLASILGLSDVVPFGEEQIGRVGVLPSPLSLEDFASLVKEKLSAPYVNFAGDGKAAHRIAVLGGSGKSDIDAAKSAGADTYLSGELGYHALIDASQSGINLVEAGHFFTEDHVLAVLSELLREADASLEAEIFSSYRIKTI